MCQNNEVKKNVKTAEELKEAMHDELFTAKCVGGFLMLTLAGGLYGIYKGYQFVADQIVKY